MTKSVLFAGVLGGVLGGAGSFALTRSFPSVAKPVAGAETPPQSEARPLADNLVKLLRAGKNDEFLTAVRSGFAELTDEQFEQGVKLPMKAMRENFTKAYGPPGDFEFVRESAPGPNLVRFAYLEKFPNGCVVWLIVFYNGGNGWQVMGFRYLKLESAFDTLR